ncbi:MAG: cysteine--tRNA ligase [Candidatus Pacearchaeota archaeon]|nr:MAG: cysteine--tRNA ligase [Candidatus Pacearchaeota archaeon]
MLKLYNTLTRKKEAFKPIRDGYVGLYTCGPTVYDYAHIGNFRAYIASDVLKKYLLYKGLKVKHVMNLTDVDDKTIAKSQKENIPIKQLTDKYIKAFFKDLKALNISEADIFPRATEHIKEMVELVKKLLAINIAYKSEDGIYYDIKKFKGYGKLSHFKIGKLKTGARIRADLYEKHEARDFALWKFWTKEDGNVFWKTEIGKGRPGWHIECSAMSMKYLGEHFDIHTGGTDLIFPHHENEIAQSEVATGKKFVNFWIHNEWLLVEGKKMSKSLGNYYTLRDLLKKRYNARAIRYLLITTHYRQQLNFTFKGLEAAKQAIKRLDEFMLKLQRTKKGENEAKIKKLIERIKEDFEKALDDDLDITKALASLFVFVREINKAMDKNKLSEENARKIHNLMLKFNSVLGLGLDKVQKIRIPEKIKKLMKEREEARKKKNFKKADKIREQIKKEGYIIEDTLDGPQIKEI